MMLRALVAGLTTAALTLSGSAQVQASPAQPLQGSSTTSVNDRSGSGRDTAAASCVEIKQLHPTSPDAAYWLLTPRMNEPARFWCDMTTDGGGWVRVGSGREQWTTAYDGKGRPDYLWGDTPSLTRAIQLPSTTVDALLDGNRVDGLTDGVRVRRATNAAGTGWQEARLAFADRDRWAWTMGAEHRVGTYRFDGAGGSGGLTSSFGLDQSLRRVNTTTQSAQSFNWGFAYGTQVTGTPGSESYLWSAVAGQGSALPYAEVYLRPRLMSADLRFPAIADSGTKSITLPRVPDSRALPNPWGVSGIAGDPSVEGNVEVQAFEQIGNVMYVGGNFRDVQRDSTGSGRVQQSFLAAFDATTGAFLPGFAPGLNEQVRALQTLPNGQLAVGGDFTAVNGKPVAGLVSLSPSTGATTPGWGTKVENTIAPNKVKVRALDVSGGRLYLGGLFSHLSGADGTGRTYARNAGRVEASTGRPDAWNPEFNGAALDLDVSDDGSRVYFSGHFSTAHGAAAPRAAAVMTTAGAPLDPTSWRPVWSNTAQDRQQAIAQAGDRVWVGGSEHSLFSFSTSTYQRLSGNITKRHGDFQAIDAAGDQLFAGCHCTSFVYQDAYTWPNVGTRWSQADAIGWFGLWNTATGAYQPHFTPELSSRLGQGIRALKVATDGSIWAGGDLTTGRTTAGGRWLGGFAQFAPLDSTPPGQPTGLRVASATDTTVELTWQAAAGSPVGYQILRDDRVVAKTNGGRTITVDRAGQGRFFVRAVDARGNVSASTPVLQVAPADDGVDRLAGTDRFGTAAVISQSYPAGLPTVYVANGLNFPDALAGAALAGKNNAPVLLVTPDKIPGATATALNTLRPQRIAVLGGTGAVDDTVKGQLKAYATADTTDEVIRLAGTDRFGTAAVISQSYPAGLPTVYVANGLNFPDALAGAALAGKNNAPVLLVTPDKIPGATATALNTLRPQRIAVLGGTGAVDDTVKGQLKAYATADTTDEVTRLAGTDRFGTAAVISQSYPAGLPTVYVANGLNFPDALAGAALAGKNNAPVLLVTPDKIPGATATALNTLRPQRIAVLGGTSAISGTIKGQLGAYVG